MRTALPLALVAALAVAGESFTLTLADGKEKAVSLESFDAEGLTATQGGRELRIAWSELAPESAYGARRALTPYDDGAARLELSEFARGLGLFPEAVEQLEIALALGGIDEPGYEKRARAITEEEIAYLEGHIDTLVAADAEPELILKAIKRLKERYPDHEANRAYEERIPRLVERLAAEAEAAQNADEEAEESAALARLRRTIEKLDRKKAEAVAKGDELRKETEEAIEKRQVSRIERQLVGHRGAERYYKRARDYLREMARADRRFLIVAKEDLQKQYDDLEKKLVACYLEVARSKMRQRNYKGAVEWVRKILLYDPIHEEALEMVEEIKKNRITFKVSDITNARPRVTGG